MYTEQEVLKEIYAKFTLHEPLDNVNGRMFITQWHDENVAGWYKQWGMDFHGALDMRADIGTPVKAVIDGTITRQYTDPGRDTKKLEYTVIRTEPFELFGTLFVMDFPYLHLSKSFVHEGQKVKAGDKISLTGNTGEYTTAPHLHLEGKIYKLDKVTNQFILAFPNNGTFGTFDLEPMFYHQDFANRQQVGLSPTVDPIRPDSLVKSKYEANIYWIDNMRRVWLIANEETLLNGSKDMWDIKNIIEIKRKLRHRFIFNI